MPKTRLSAAAYLFVVFASGVLVGVFSYRLYTISTVTATVAPARPTPEEWRRKYVNDLRTRLKLDDPQVARLQQILDETRAEFKAFHDRTQPEVQAIQKEQVGKIRAMLTDDQRPAYDAWRQERERRRSAGGGGGGGHPRGH